MISDVTETSIASWMAPLAKMAETQPVFAETLEAAAAAVSRVPLEGMLESLSLTAKSLELPIQSWAALCQDLAFAKLNTDWGISCVPAYAGLDALNGLFGNISAEMGLAGALSPEILAEPGAEVSEEEFVRVVREGWAAPGVVAPAGQDDAASLFDVVRYRDDQGRLTVTVASLMALIAGAVAWTADLTMNGEPSPIAALLVAGTVFGWCRNQR